MVNHYLYHKLSTAAVVVLLVLVYLSIKSDKSYQSFIPYEHLPIFGTTVVEWWRDHTPEKYCVWFNFTQPSNTSDFDEYGVPKKISLCTHGSIAYAKYVFDYTKNWNDSISVALLIDDNSFEGLAAYKLLADCDPAMKKLVSTHLVWEKSGKSRCNADRVLNKLSSVTTLPQSCDFADFAELFNAKLSSPYPPNTLRNIARHGARRKFHLIADIENQFSANAAEFLNIAIDADESQTQDVTVIRRFEYDEKLDPPSTPQELSQMLEDKTAYPFHFFLSKKDHEIPGMTPWLNYSSNPENNVKYDVVSYQGAFWEPQLVVHASHPYHFEGFPIRKADQQALPYELCRKNTTFKVVTHVFSLHDGIKKTATATETKLKAEATTRGRNVAARFLKIMNDRYPNTENNCGRWPKQ